MSIAAIGSHPIVPTAAEAEETKALGQTTMRIGSCGAAIQAMQARPARAGRLESTKLLRFPTSKSTFGFGTFFEELQYLVRDICIMNSSICRSSDGLEAIYRSPLRPATGAMQARTRYEMLRQSNGFG